MFEDELNKLVALELPYARRSPDRGGAMIEAVARALGSAVAIVSQGDPATVDALMAGAESYAHEEAVQRAPLGKWLASQSG